jgi:hypothetical protein
VLIWPTIELGPIEKGVAQNHQFVHTRLESVVWAGDRKEPAANGRFVGKSPAGRLRLIHRDQHLATFLDRAGVDVGVSREASTPNHIPKDGSAGSANRDRRIRPANEHERPFVRFSRSEREE